MVTTTCEGEWGIQFCFVLTGFLENREHGYWMAIKPTPVFLPGESQGRGSLVGCRLWGHTVRHDCSDLAAVAAAAGP